MSHGFERVTITAPYSWARLYPCILDQREPTPADSTESLLPHAAATTGTHSTRKGSGTELLHEPERVSLLEVRSSQQNITTGGR